jgi:hypothetical protein
VSFRIDDPERLAKIHNDMLAAVAPYRSASGVIDYTLADTTKAINAVAKAIVTATMTEVVTDPAPSF